MGEQSDSRDTFDRLAGEYDELKLRVIPGRTAGACSFSTKSCFKNCSGM